jgi:cellulose biosynthesis protein BcsQ
MSTQQDPKLQVAQNVVDGMPGMYKAAAELAKDQDQKQLLHQAADTFQTIISNPDTRMALVESLLASPLMDTIMAKTDVLQKDPEAMKTLTNEITETLSAPLQTTP